MDVSRGAPAGGLREGRGLIGTARETLGVVMEATQPTDRIVDAVERYRSLLEINNAIITHLEKEDLFRATCGALQEIVPYQAAGIAIYEPELDSFRFFALEGELSSDRFSSSSWRH